MWFWCQAFSLDLHLNDLFKSSNIKTCQQSSAQCAQHGKPHNLLFLYTRNEGLPAQSLNDCRFWEKISISQALTLRLPSNPPTYWFIFEAKIYSQWSVGETPAHFQEHFDIFPLKNVIMELFWARKVIKAQGCVLLPQLYLCSVSYQRSHWPNIIDWYQRYWFWSHYLFIYFATKNLKVVCLFHWL